MFLISFAQAYSRLAQDREFVRFSLTSSVKLSAEQAFNVIDASEKSLVSLATRDEVLYATADCAQTLAIAQLAMPSTTNISRLNADGVVICSAHEMIKSAETDKKPWLSSLSDAGEISFVGPVVEPTSNVNVIHMALGLQDKNDVPIGHIVVGINLNKLEADLQKRKGLKDARLKLVDRDGIAVHHASATSFIVTRQEIEIESEKISPGKVVETRDQKGNLWTYAGAPVVQDRLFVILSLPDSVLYSSTIRHVVTDIALPLIALIFASAGLWFAAQLWAVSPIEALRTLAKQYSVGRFDTTPPLLNYGPNEMRELRDEMSGMAQRAEHRDDRLKRIANQKEILVKELHHRVKNNLQIIISLISLQSRQAVSPDQKATLEHIHRRITAMALVERLIIEGGDNAVINVHSLLEELCGLLRRTYLQESLRVQLKFESEPTQILTDMATPLGLFAFEAISNAYRHGFNDVGKGEIMLRYSTNHDGLSVLEIEDTGIGWRDLSKNIGTGHKLLQAFARQLGGTMDVSCLKENGCRVAVTFNAKLAYSERKNEIAAV